MPLPLLAAAGPAAIAAGAGASLHAGGSVLLHVCQGFINGTWGYRDQNQHKNRQVRFIQHALFTGLTVQASAVHEMSIRLTGEQIARNRQLVENEPECELCPHD
jgi:hypothetical protein